MVPIMRSSASMRNHATAFGLSPALLAEGFSSSHGKHSPVAMVSHITEETTPLFPFVATLEDEKSALDAWLLEVDGPAIAELNQHESRHV